MPDIEQIRTENSELIAKVIKRLPKITYDTVAHSLPQLFATGLLELNLLAYPPADATATTAAGIGRYLIYDNGDLENPFSIWMFAFAPKQKTCIHDHQYRGCVTVLQGPVSEKYYTPSDDGSVRLITRADRYRFHSNTDDLDDNFVHQLKRRKGLGDGVSVTLHIYNMHAHLVDQLGTISDNRNLNVIYSKAPAEQEPPPYEALYPAPVPGPVP
ncbi:MAG: cysteine dioxygenase [Legionella sp.]